MEHGEKVRENRLRRAAKRQGLALVKSRRRDPRAIGYGTYELVDLELNILIVPYPNEIGLDLDEIEAWLSEGQR